MRSVLTCRESGHRLSDADLRVEAKEAGGSPMVRIDTACRFQVLEGFGGAFTEAAAYTWHRMDASRRSSFLRDCFDCQAGHGYTLCRVHMNSCDFALGNYAHVEQAGDVDLHSFTIERDRRWLLPFIKAAQGVAGQALKLLVSPWSPPAWMKSNGQMNHGGTLLPQYRRAWARCFVRFIQAYAEEGVPVWAVSVQNEPAASQRWDSCLYSAEEERDFVRDHLGPELAAAGLGHVKIVIWDHNRDRLVERAGTVYADAEASKYVWGAGFHWYGEDHFEQVQLTHDAWPDKQLLFTEGCQEGGPHLDSWDLGERYAHSMINDLNRWTVGWIDWNLLLDDSGGPNHVGNLCSAPVLVERSSGELLYQSSYHYIGHFARFIRPGARRVLCASSRQDLEATAFVNPDGGAAAVLLNRSAQPIRFLLHADTFRQPCELPARSIATLLWQAGPTAQARPDGR